MKLVGNKLQKTFVVNYQSKEYYINYLNSDYHDSPIINRDYWEVADENGDELNIYCLKSFTKEEKHKVKLNINKFEMLVRFCIKNFNSYSPKFNIIK